MWPYPWTHVGTPSHLGHMDRVAATMPSQAHAGAAQEAPDIGQWEGQDVPLVRPSSCNVKGGISSSRRYLPTLQGTPQARSHARATSLWSGATLLLELAWSAGILPRWAGSTLLLGPEVTLWRRNAFDAFPWGAWPRDAAVDTHKQAGRQSTALTGASSRSCHVTKRFRILATLKQRNKSMYSNTSGYVHMGLRLD